MIIVREYATARARTEQKRRIEMAIAFARATGKKPRLSIRAATAANSKHGRK